jgi:hypothetical protein
MLTVKTSMLILPWRKLLEEKGMQVHCSVCSAQNNTNAEFRQNESVRISSEQGRVLLT